MSTATITAPDQTTTTNPTITLETGWDAWVRHRLLPTLRDGSYAQGHCMLNDSQGHFCVWGVAIDLALNDGLLTGAWVQPDDNAAGYYVEPNGNHWLMAPPAALIEQIGLTRKQAAKLMHANDRGTPFPLLADIIAAIRASNTARREATP